MSDKLIKEALKERGFSFKKLDDPDKMVVGRGGNLYKILIAGTGSARAADELLAEVNGFDELAERLVGYRFVGTTKKSKDGKYVQLDGNEEIFPVARELVTVPASADPRATESDEDFEDLDMGEEAPF